MSAHMVRFGRVSSDMGRWERGFGRLACLVLATTPERYPVEAHFG